MKTPRVLITAITLLISTQALAQSLGHSIDDINAEITITSQAREAILSKISPSSVPSGLNAHDYLAQLPKFKMNVKNALLHFENTLRTQILNNEEFIKLSEQYLSVKDSPVLSEEQKKIILPQRIQALNAGITKLAEIYSKAADDLYKEAGVDLQFTTKTPTRKQIRKNSCLMSLERDAKMDQNWAEYPCTIETNSCSDAAQAPTNVTKLNFRGYYDCDPTNENSDFGKIYLGLIVNDAKRICAIGATNSPSQLCVDLHLNDISNILDSLRQMLAKSYVVKLGDLELTITAPPFKFQPVLTVLKRGKDFNISDLPFDTQ